MSKRRLALYPQFNLQNYCKLSEIQNKNSFLFPKRRVIYEKLCRVQQQMQHVTKLVEKFEKLLFWC